MEHVICYINCPFQTGIIIPERLILSKIISVISKAKLLLYEIPLVNIQLNFQTVIVC